MYILGKGGFAISLDNYLRHNHIDYKGFVSLDSDIPILFTREGITKPFDYDDNASFILGTSNLSWRTRFLDHFKGYYPLSEKYFPNIVLGDSLMYANGIGVGNLFMPNTIVENRTTLGDFNLINTYASIGYSCTIGNNNVLDCYANIRHGSSIQNLNYIGSKACIDKNLIIGSNNIVECGECLFDDMKDAELFQSGIITKKR
jgi:hypothetical protein